MKINNLKIKKTAFSLGLSFILMGCSNNQVEITSTKIIEEVEEKVNIERDNNEAINIKLEDDNIIPIFLRKRGF